MQPIYDPEAVKPMEEELHHVGVRSLKRPEEVDEMLAQKEGTTLVVINSVCGCAAGGARPGVTLALQHKVIPDRLTTVFAGVDREAVERVRAAIPLPPSSPFIVLFKDGEPIFALQRQQIEMMDAPQIARELTEAFDRYCSAQGPSVSPEDFEKIVRANQCGSTIPLNPQQ